MKRTLKKNAWLLSSFFTTLLITLFLSCSDEALNNSDFVAGDVFTDSNIRVVFMDTLTVETTTMRFDSINTSQSSRILLGKYVDPIFGKIECSSYFEMLPLSYSIDAESEYDSIALYLKYDTYYYNDTLQINTVHVKQLKKKLKPYDGSAFYNTSNAEYFEEDIGLLTYRPRPMKADSLEIILTDSIGKGLFNRLQDKSITNSNEFKEYFKGLALQPDENDDGSVIGFSRSAGASYMRLYFSASEEGEHVQDYIDFNINISSSPVPFFNRIVAEEPNEYLKILTDKEINLNSSDSENRSFIQSGIGIATRIQFPHIKSVYDINGRGTLLDAVLKIRPALGTYNEQLILRDSLSVYIVDRNNDITEQLARATLNKDNQEFNDIYYEIPLGSYIEKLLLTERNTDEAIILLPNNYNATIDRFVLNGNDRPKYKTILELIYAIYDEDE